MQCYYSMVWGERFGMVNVPDPELVVHKSDDIMINGGYLYIMLQTLYLLVF